jgi:hypothetical protein
LKKKKHIPFAFDEVRQTINTPTNIVTLVNRANAITAVIVQCPDHQEYSLIKKSYDDSEENKEIYKAVGTIDVIFTLLITLTDFAELY